MVLCSFFELAYVPLFSDEREISKSGVMKKDYSVKHILSELSYRYVENKVENSDWLYDEMSRYAEYYLFN